MSRLDLVALVGPLLILVVAVILDGKKLGERRASAGRERINCKKGSSPSTEVGSAVVRLLWYRSSRLGPQLLKLVLQQPLELLL